MNYDVIIVGAGPAGLSCAIRFAQLCRENNKEYTVCVLEKGAEVGAHTLSGAVIDPKALFELIPDALAQGAPLNTPVTSDAFYYLTQHKSFQLPTPPTLHNKNNYAISLGQLAQWLAKQAESLGVDIFPGFPAQSLVFDQDQSVIGVQTGDMGIDKNHQHKSNFQAGMQIQGQYTLLAEGCRGHLSQQIIHQFQLNQQQSPQTYGIGLKELWEVNSPDYQAGTVFHTIGWPLDNHTYGGSFVYHLSDQLVSIGFVIGLDYQNPYLNPYLEFQRFKHHPLISNLLKNGRCLKYGARAINEGGWQSIPNLAFKGGLLLGCAAGFLNVARIKGTHTAMKSGMIAAEQVFEALNLNQSKPKVIQNYQTEINQSWIKTELYAVRNIRPSFHWGGLWGGLLYSAIDTYVFRGKAPWTFKHDPDHAQIKPASQCKPIDYPKPDGVISFDKLTNLARANVFHDDDQPCHLELKDANIPVNINYKQYAGLEIRYCPAGVYEYVESGGETKLQINAQNCVHCKTCDIKDPSQNIHWVPPEGGGGPNYSNM